jgi:hypothetical protein
MKFHIQRGYDCQIVALQTILSFFNKYPTQKELKAQLPMHSFGNIITEIGIFLNTNGISTVLIGSLEDSYLKNKLFKNSFSEYLNFGSFENRRPVTSDINSMPVLINVDWYKIKNPSTIHHAPHYVVAIKENDSTYLYDGSNYKRKVKTSFNKLLHASTDINKYHSDGMWLVTT